ncbi:menaquinone-dependent protoporphyrinogen IX oxidase [Natronobacillus azotifigens]|uniref:Flavodoxin domain-containing protein n=1 Tax=Natronobacillus azotifigens TaxID=472978 RepID=A0A9J6RCJ5_9BACI|nr:flavodoxin domain-containing protein [Natronobacillus azotifigens]MCZ0702929.1 hypothetical protein [Natronobacillus azotifigens]
MKSILIVYKTKTGFTKKYVEWISETISCQTIPLEQIDHVDTNTYDLIIYGAGIHAGRIQGLKEFKKKAWDVVDGKVAIFATGGAPYDEAIITKIKTNNFSEHERKDMELFYFQSGLNYEKMGLFEKMIMNIYRKVLEFKNNKSDVEDGTSKAIARSYDHSSREYIKPMIDYVNQLADNEWNKV